MAAAPARRRWSYAHGLLLTDYYFGAGGVFWGVSHLSRQGWIASPQDGSGCSSQHSRIGVSPPLDALLLEAGELIHEAGALRKGPSLCHGTAGNGFALLKLFERTGDERWLQRARQFAMHALWQVERSRELFSQGRHSLWTGDIGAAVFMNECLREAACFPTTDVF
jgi:hypothetical protein